MSLRLLRDEIQHEMNAVQKFIELAIAAQSGGYLHAAQYFLSEAREDCMHSFLYARELDKHGGVDDTRNIVEILKQYYELESGALSRIHEIHKQAKEENIHSITPFLSKMMGAHSEDAYKAQKLLETISILFANEDIVSTEDLFKELEESEKIK